MAKYDATRPILRTGVLVLTLFYVVRSDESCDIEIENTLKTLLTPQEYPTIQLQALRKNMLRRFQEALDKAEEEDETNYKRSISSLAQWNHLPEIKRNLEALARAGYIRTLPNQDPDNDDPNTKRSIANLAKNGQLPTNIDNKRGIASLARNGELRHRKDIQELLDELYDKRNIDSLARNFNFPSSTYGKRFVGSLARSGDLLHYSGKRNVAALARDGTKIGGKRNVAALLRQDSYMNDQLSGDGRTEMPQASGEGKRNIGSIKAQYSGMFKRSVDGVRMKREADYYDGETEELSSPVYQNQNVYDYEELMRELTGVYPNTEKRFLGRLPQMGKPKTTPSPKVRFH